jgi:hypothetical protein
MANSILDDVKKVLGLDASYTVYDIDVIMHINTAFGVLNQLGIGPDVGFSISDNTAVWDDFTAGDVLLNMVKSAIYLRVRLLFDPPTTSYLIESMRKQLEELEVRLNINREYQLPAV